VEARPDPGASLNPLLPCQHVNVSPSQKSCPSPQPGTVALLGNKGTEAAREACSCGSGRTKLSSSSQLFFQAYYFVCSRLWRDVSSRCTAHPGKQPSGQECNERSSSLRSPCRSKPRRCTVFASTAVFAEDVPLKHADKILMIGAISLAVKNSK